MTSTIRRELAPRLVNLRSQPYATANPAFSCQAGMTAQYQIRDRGYPPNGGRRLVTRPKVASPPGFRGLQYQSSLASNSGASRQEFTCFSYDDNHAYRHDDSSLRWYYHSPLDVGADLSAGFGTFDKHDDSADEHLVSLLRSLVGYERENGRVDVGLVTWRGMMTKVRVVPCS